MNEINRANFPNKEIRLLKTYEVMSQVQNTRRGQKDIFFGSLDKASIFAGILDLLIKCMG